MELLIVVFGLQRLQRYAFGSKIMVQTDHKPLNPTWKKSITAASPWPQHIQLRLAKYDVALTYLKGKYNVIAHAQSQVSPLEPEDKENFGVIPVNHIAS